jgi:predicted CoA-binding protein
MQDGVINEPAAAKARAAGMLVVMDRCMMRDHMTLG